MAYVIGSEKGKNIAKNMKTGESYKCSDGSTWTKKSDGSVSVTTSSGQTFNNAYKPTSSSSGSSKGSSGGSSKKNSQYTAPTLGGAWDANTDYQAIINNAVSNGDYVTAAKAEQLRNQKIIASGLNYETTNKYGGHLDGIDYGIVGKNQMANGASWEDVLSTYNSRYNKATTTEGLQQYANDDVQQMMWQYIQDNMKQSNQQEAQDMFNQWLQDYEQDNPRQEYESKYDSKIDALLNQILNRDDFSYEVMNDPLYQQYAQMYQREGDRAMRDTLAEVAAGAGGMNSYAITAAQQANNYYNSQLNDKVPELYQIAYQMYLNDKESKVQDLGILQNMDATQYGRYRDTINDWYNDKKFAFSAFQNAVDQGNLQNSFDYNSMVNNRDFMYNDIWKNKEWNEKQAEKDYNKSLYDKESAKEEVWKLIGLGVTPSADLIARAGMSESDVALAVAAVKAQAETKFTSQSSGGSGSNGSGSDSAEDMSDSAEDMSDYTVGNQHSEEWVYVNGHGRLSWMELLYLVDRGEVEEVIDKKNKTIRYKKA